jgi:hypothetical protein
LVSCGAHPFGESQQIVFADPVLKRVCKLAQLDGAVAHFILESQLNGEHDFLLQRDGLWPDGPILKMYTVQLLISE